MTHELESKAKAEFERCQTVAPPLRPTPWFRPHRTLDSWSRYRRVVCKLTMMQMVPSVALSSPHFLLIRSSLVLYTDYYCPRGDMENRLGTPLDLFGDRTSAHFDANQLRLWFSSVAYVLMQALRQHPNQMSYCTTGHHSYKLLKLGQIRISVRRFIAISACPCQRFCYCLQKIVVTHTS